MLGEAPKDRSSLVVEAIWNELGRPRLVCGHMHARYQAGPVLVLGDMDSEAL